MAITDKDKKEKTPPHAGSVGADNPELAAWIERQWLSSEQPTVIDAYQMVGRNKQDRGERVYHRDFKPGTEVKQESAVVISNEILGDCQNDCDSLEREQVYGIMIYDKARSSEPWTWRLRLHPKRAYLVPSGGQRRERDTDDVDDDGTGKDILLRRFNAMNEAAKWKDEHDSRVTGDLMLVLMEMNKQSQGHVSTLMDKVVSLFGSVEAMFHKMLEAQDTGLDRETAREWSKLKMSLAKDGVRTARGLLFSMFPENSNGSGVTKGLMSSRPIEITLIDAFLRDCEEEKIDGLLFGEMAEKDGKAVVTKEGIFSRRQLELLLAVQRGALSVDALLVLLPDSGAPEAITAQQMKDAYEHMGEGITHGVVELFKRLNERRESSKKKESPTTSTVSTTSTLSEED